MSAEEWRPIPGYDGAYEASTEGRIRSLDRMTTGRRAFRIKGRILRPALNPAGYPFVALCRDGVHRSLTVHRLIALTFLGPRPEGLEICHGDGDRTNAALSNLRYDTKSANAYDRVRHGNHLYANRTHCLKGHAYDELNTHWRSDGGRKCITCEVARAQSRKKTSRVNKRSAA